jgi:hypothetical protein
MQIGLHNIACAFIQLRRIWFMQSSERGLHRRQSVQGTDKHHVCAGAAPPLVE